MRTGLRCWVLAITTIGFLAAIGLLIAPLLEGAPFLKHARLLSKHQHGGSSSASSASTSSSSSHLRTAAAHSEDGDTAEESGYGENGEVDENDDDGDNDDAPRIVEDEGDDSNAEHLKMSPFLTPEDIRRPDLKLKEKKTKPRARQPAAGGIGGMFDVFGVRTEARRNRRSGGDATRDAGDGGGAGGGSGGSRGVVSLRGSGRRTGDSAPAVDTGAPSSHRNGTSGARATREYGRTGDLRLMKSAFSPARRFVRP